MPKQAREEGDFSGNPEAISEAAQLTREIADSRAAETRARAKELIPGPHMIPMEGDTQKAYDSIQYLKERQEKEAELRIKREQEDQGKYRYYLKCRSPSHTIGETSAPPHGIYFVKDPQGDIVKDHDWFATYKRKTEVWRQDVVCQVCLKMGIEQATLPVVWANPRKLSEGFKPDERWIWKSPIDVKQWEIEGDTRAHDLPTAASNMWREALAKKLGGLVKTGV